MNTTELEFDNALAACRSVFAAKLEDYGASWRIMRACSITDQLYIKAKRIRSIGTKCDRRVDEGILPEFMAIVNYGLIGLIQLENGYSDDVDITPDEALALYDKFASAARSLMLDKNHDYDEAWRMMRVCSYTDFILTKISRIKEIEDHNGLTTVSEGIDSNYMDIVNYAVFGVIKLQEENAG